MIQTDGMIMDNYGMLYFGLLRSHAICKWDSYRPFTLENQQIVAKDDTHIQWTDGEFPVRKISVTIVMNLLMTKRW